MQNQVKLDSRKLARIAEYEARIEALTQTLSVWSVFLALILLNLVTHQVSP